MERADNLIIHLDNINGHIGRHDRFDGVHGGHDIGQRNLEERYKSFAWRKHTCQIHLLK